jgi:GNAT superfamily N-acetyltransferase
MSVSVRAARPVDLEFLVDCIARMAVETDSAELDRELVAEGVALALADERKGRYFVADDGEEPVGMLRVTADWSDARAGWFWWLQTPYVVPEARGNGVFTALWEHLLALARGDWEVCGLRLGLDRRQGTAEVVCERLGLIDAGWLVYEADFSRATATRGAAFD